MKKLSKDIIDRTIIDKSKKIIRFETEKNGKIENKFQCNISVIKHVNVVVNSYNEMDIYLLDIYSDLHLNSATNFVRTMEQMKHFHIIENKEIPDSAEKLKLAHQIAEFLGVSVIEKT